MYDTEAANKVQVQVQVLVRFEQECVAEHKNLKVFANEGFSFQGYG